MIYEINFGNISSDSLSSSYYYSLRYVHITYTSIDTSPCSVNCIEDFHFSYSFCCNSSFSRRILSNSANYYTHINKPPYTPPPLFGTTHSFFSPSFSFLFLFFFLLSLTLQLFLLCFSSCHQCLEPIITHSIATRFSWTILTCFLSLSASLCACFFFFHFFPPTTLVAESFVSSSSVSDIQPYTTKRRYLLTSFLSIGSSPQVVISTY